MIKLILNRLETSDEGTFGRLFINEVMFFTGELPWRNNRDQESCIKEGVYLCVWDYSLHFKRNMYGVTGVDGRSGVRIHSANYMGDRSLGYRCQLEGCISLGEKIGTIDGQKALLLSRPAIEKFQSIMNKENFLLEVKNELG